MQVKRLKQHMVHTGQHQELNGDAYGAMNLHYLWATVV